MATPLRFAVLTSSDVEAGTVVNHLMSRTGLRVERIYYDTRSEKGTGGNRPNTPRGGSSPSRWERLRWHLALALRLPGHYCWRMLEKWTGRTQLDLLRFCERVSPYLFRRLCGVAFDPSLPCRGKVLYSLEEVTGERRIPLVTTDNVNNAETVRSLSDLRPDVIIGLGTRILSKETLATATVGVLNGHSSLLPAYRGSTTEFWQLVGGETETGVTIHWMVPRVDQGAICAQRRWAIPRGADHHLLRLMSLFYRLELWADVVRALLAGTLPGSPQGASPTPTFRRPTLRQEYEFYCRGVRPKALLAKP
jgi:Formyl transferase